MSQINIRVTSDEKMVLSLLANVQGITITELVKSQVFLNFKQKRVDLAFKLLDEGKIGRTKAWKISGLTGHEFLREWTNRDAEEKLISDEIAETMLTTALSMNLDSYKKHK